MKHKIWLYPLSRYRAVNVMNSLATHVIVYSLGLMQRSSSRDIHPFTEATNRKNYQEYKKKKKNYDHMHWTNILTQN